MTAKQLGDKIAEAKEKRSAIHQLGVTEKRSLSEDEQTQYETFTTEIRSLERQQKIAQEAEAEAAELATRSNKPLGKEDNEQKRQNDLGNYSFLRAIQNQINPNSKPFDGLELEMHQEAVTEARAVNQTINGVGIPAMLMRARTMEKRDNSVTMPTQPEDGAAVVQTEKRISLEDMLRNALMTVSLGATYFRDLTGNLDFVRMTERPVATFKPEVAELQKSNIKFGKNAQLTPKRLGTYTIHSKQFLLQTAPSIETKIRTELAYSIAEGIDKAAIYGDGADNEPLGILNLTGGSGITFLNTAGANTGAALTRANLITAIVTLMKKNVNGRNYGWLINAETVGKLMDTVVAANSDIFIMNELDRLLMYPAAISNTIISDGTKGTATALSDLVFGAWENLYIAQWGGYDLTVDAVTLATAGQVRLIIQAFADVAVYEPKAFVAYRDIKNV